MYMTGFFNYSIKWEAVLIVIGIVFSVVPNVYAQSTEILFPNATGIGATPGSSNITLYYPPNAPIDNLIFPEALEGTGTQPLTYLLIGDLPRGLTFGSRTLSGTPVAPTTAIQVMYKVTDANNTTDMIDVSIVICEAGGGAANGATVCSIPTYAPLVLQAVPDQKFSVNRQITPVPLGEATGGTGTSPARRYSLNPKVPGLSFSTTRFELSGTPTEAGTTQVVYLVRDAGSPDSHDRSASVTFQIVVSTAPTFAVATIEDKIFPQGVPVDLTLPEATGGELTITYSLTGLNGALLPLGLSFDPSTRKITGTPTAITPTTTYTYKVVDGDDDTADTDIDSRTFTITVPDTSPSFNTGIDNQAFMIETPFTLTLPIATAGNGDITYTLTRQDGLPLPIWLNFNPTSRKITGTPPDIFAAATYTYTARDADDNVSVDDTGVINFQIKVNPREDEVVYTDTTPIFVLNRSVLYDNIFFSNTVNSRAIATLESVNGPLTTTITPNLPNGITVSVSINAGVTNITLNSTSSVAVSPKATYTLRVTDVDGDFVERGFTLAVDAQNTAPSFGTNTIADQVFTQHTTITTLQLPEATGGNGDNCL